MNAEEEIFKLAQKVAVLESKIDTYEQQLNGLGETLRHLIDTYEQQLTGLGETLRHLIATNQTDIKAAIKERLDEPLYGIEPRLCVAERNIFKAQIYTAAIAATATSFAIIIQYTLTSLGINVGDLFIKAKK